MIEKLKNERLPIKISEENIPRITQIPNCTAINC
jgi:hypothetical protein